MSNLGDELLDGLKARAESLGNHLLSNVHGRDKPRARLYLQLMAEILADPRSDRSRVETDLKMVQGGVMSVVARSAFDAQRESIAAAWDLFFFVLAKALDIAL